MPDLGLIFQVGRSASESAGKGNTLNAEKQMLSSAGLCSGCRVNEANVRTSSGRVDSALSMTDSLFTSNNWILGHGLNQRPYLDWLPSLWTIFVSISCGSDNLAIRQWRLMRTSATVDLPYMDSY
jgi:hypothetical protein